MQSSIERFVVVVPVHNEELLLDHCMRALAVAMDSASRVADVVTDVVVALDACTDASADIADAWARRAGVTVVSLDRRNVGAARAAGFRAVSTSQPASGTWFATTDADSTVRPDWLTSMCAHRARGARVVAGTVAADFGAESPFAESPFATSALQVAYDADYRNSPGHVHGANLGMCAEDYWSVGGFAALETDEDVDLVRRFGLAGIDVLYADDCPVGTSTRRIGRAPDGFSGHLRSLELAQAR